MFAELAALIVSSGSTLSTPPMLPADLPHIFIAACLDGEARLPATEARAISFEGLPRDLQRRLPAPVSSEIWRLNQPGRAFLYILDYAAAANQTQRICGVASDDMDLPSASPVVERRVVGDVYPETGKSMQWENPAMGYIVTATYAGSFKVLQTELLSDAARAALARKYKSVVR